MSARSRSPWQSATWLVASLVATASLTAAEDVDQLLTQTAVVRAMQEETLIRLVPEQSGLQYVDCPHCDAGRQERQLEWTIDRPDVVTCRYCQHEYPSATYPMRDAVIVRTPRGEPAQFAYWADTNGYRHFFKARRDDEVRRYLATQTLTLARLYRAAQDPAHARRAAVLLDRFAQVFPSWCYHFDYPFRQKEIYDGDVPPEQFRSGFRTARWTWWAYVDIPIELVEAYQLIRGSGQLELLSDEQGVDVADRIECDLLRNAGEQVLANPDDFTNMSPAAWRSLVLLGRAIDEPRYVHEVERRFQRLMELQFFYDGTWYEGAPSYGSQTISGLDRVIEALRGYTDPPGYRDPADGRRFDDLDLDRDDARLMQARSVLTRMRYPDGHPLPVHDTWAQEAVGAPAAPVPYLVPALGHACLRTGGERGRCEFHLSWSGGYGHQHADLLSLLAFGHDRELFSDLGYTHTAYRAWTIATAAHNTVVVDGLSQHPGSRDAPTDGSLRFIDLQHPEVQVVSVDGRRAYPDVATEYQRTLVMISAGDGRQYVVDVFDVAGGQTHDYFLHGNASESAAVTADADLHPLTTLLPDGFVWQPPRNEGDAGRAYQPHDAYGFLRNLTTTTVPPSIPVQVEFASPAASPTGARVTLLAPESFQLVLGENPSIRGAREDDARLDEFQRPFMMIRSLPKEGRTRFVAVIEPFDEQPATATAQRLPTTNGALALKVQHESRTDVIVIGAETEQAITLDADVGRQARFQGRIGVLTLNDHTVERIYALGDGGWRLGDAEFVAPAQQEGILVAAEADGIEVSGDQLTAPSPGDVIRLMTTDGWIYPYTVGLNSTKPSTAERLRLTLSQRPGFDYDVAGAQLRFRTFPQRQHAGPVRVLWQPGRVWQRAAIVERLGDHQ